jgi:hypothetical protein
MGMVCQWWTAYDSNPDFFYDRYTNALESNHLSYIYGRIYRI